MKQVITDDQIRVLLRELGESHHREGALRNQVEQLRGENRSLQAALALLRAHTSEAARAQCRCGLSEVPEIDGAADAGALLGGLLRGSLQIRKYPLRE